MLTFGASPCQPVNPSFSVSHLMRRCCFARSYCRLVLGAYLALDLRARVVEKRCLSEAWFQAMAESAPGGEGMVWCHWSW